MTSPTPEAYEAAARAYCVTKFPYPPTSYISDEARLGHIEYDTRGTLDDLWLRPVVDAVWRIAEREVRAKVAAEIRQKSLTWCMDGTGRHLVENCAKIAEGSIDG